MLSTCVTLLTRSEHGNTPPAPKLMSLMQVNGTRRASSLVFGRLESAGKQSLRPGALEVVGD